MTYEQAAVMLFETAFAKFRRDEYPHILSGVNERSLCGRLAIALHEQLTSELVTHFLNPQELSQYLVDIEYNRTYGGRIKTILGEEYTTVVINCDVIVHTRGASEDHDNLLAIEMKKSHHRKSEKEKDRKRLRALTQPRHTRDHWSDDGYTLPEQVCGYKLGAYLELDLKAERWLVELYGSGRLLDTYYQPFRGEILRQRPNQWRR